MADSVIDTSFKVTIPPFSRTYSESVSFNDIAPIVITSSYSADMNKVRKVRGHYSGGGGIVPPPGEKIIPSGDLLPISTGDMTIDFYQTSKLFVGKTITNMCEDQVGGIFKGVDFLVVATITNLQDGVTVEASDIQIDKTNLFSAGTNFLSYNSIDVSDDFFDLGMPVFRVVYRSSTTPFDLSAFVTIANIALTNGAYTVTSSLSVGTTLVSDTINSSELFTVSGSGCCGGGFCCL